MFIQNNANERRIPLIKHWTRRYVLILLLCLMIVGLVSNYWMKSLQIEDRLTFLKFFARDLAENQPPLNQTKTPNSDIDASNHNDFDENIRKRKERFIDSKAQVINEKAYIQISNQYGSVIFQNQEVKDPEIEAILSNQKLVTSEAIETIHTKSVGTLYHISEPIRKGNKVNGNLYLFISEKDLLGDISTDLCLTWLLIIVLLGISGFFVIYWLSKRLTRPIRKVADAASQIRKGNYQVTLSEEEIREKEIYELVSSFKEMAVRLKKLEEIRTELLAGVTHELKTPITSISGLIQAVKDRVVDGEEVEEFLDISIAESKRLENMIEDLLDFNSYAVGALQVKLEKMNMNELLKEVIHHWQVTNRDDSTEVTVSLPENILWAHGDRLRIQQILFNLLRNSQAACKEDGMIKLKLYQDSKEMISVDVMDTGCGISLDEQPFIFERFFRGAAKKDRVRGLGLGLPFSKMLAKAQKGILVLKESSSDGTIFTLLLPKANKT
ncbi:HAMP domain-containing histidine kinase [Shimazuella sp. AN120528]|uniref:sensor histidine kinase n=1 Tax=Shimazuella soli TaxID=1892854 RepID=UPI001F0F99C6|nr:HAMP domain-containing sensor histidine kinase [Shimazuella soli]MCH5584712.1 HAMP domain-containing histidine kinase [Shimazuella soli]